MRFILFLLLMLALGACSSSKKEDESQHVHNHHAIEAGIINYATIYSDAEKILSFPVLFNDSVVKALQIKAIERDLIYTDGKNEALDSELINEYTTKKIVYSFKRDGFQHAMAIGNYYDSRLINTLRASFNDYSIVSGYSNIKLNEDLSREDFPYYEYKQIKSTKNLISFENVSNNSRLLVVPNDRHWKALIIDTLCKPQENDIIVWGSLIEPHKIYSVQNLVEESNVRSFTYSNKVLQRVEWSDFPFQIFRYFHYNEKGRCDAIIDSTFSRGGFVSSARFNIQLEDQLPKLITKVVKYGETEKEVFRETFRYHFY